MQQSYNAQVIIGNHIKVKCDCPPGGSYLWILRWLKSCCSGYVPPGGETDAQTVTAYSLMKTDPGPMAWTLWWLGVCPTAAFFCLLNHSGAPPIGQPPSSTRFIIDVFLGCALPPWPGHLGDPVRSITPDSLALRIRLTQASPLQQGADPWRN